MYTVRQRAFKLSKSAHATLGFGYSGPALAPCKPGHSCNANPVDGRCSVWMGHVGLMGRSATGAMDASAKRVLATRAGGSALCERPRQSARQTLRRYMRRRMRRRRLRRRGFVLLLQELMQLIYCHLLQANQLYLQTGTSGSNESTLHPFTPTPLPLPSWPCSLRRSCEASPSPPCCLRIAAAHEYQYLARAVDAHSSSRCKWPIRAHWRRSAHTRDRFGVLWRSSDRVRLRNKGDLRAWNQSQGSAAHHVDLL